MSTILGTDKTTHGGSLIIVFAIREHTTLCNSERKTVADISTH